MLSKPFENHQVIFTLVLGASLATLVAYQVYKKWVQPTRKIPTVWEEVGTLSQLFIYPVKSAKGISVNSAEATKHGLAKGHLIDRSFMLVTEKNHEMITGRNANLLVTLSTSFKDNVLTISNWDNESVQVNLEEILTNNKEINKLVVFGDNSSGIDCGDEVADWLSKTVFQNGKKVRLMHIGKTPFDRKHKTFNYFAFPFVPGDSTKFNDTTSYNIATESSLADLNSRIEKPVGFEIFRPPIVVKGTKPFEEDDWLYVKIGNKAVFRTCKPCERCMLTTIDPSTGLKNDTPLKELRKYRTVVHPEQLAKSWKTNPIFSLNVANDIEGDINVGDKVYVYREKPYWHVNGNIQSQ